MLVSQYIYTACGKDRNGAFSVFSKSKDITEEESSEIREVMIYKTPSGLPYEPTNQEIEELFPKKFGYFFLSSGRVCLAQVSYVGRVYSDLDTRWGNYIIHAFVFEKTDDFSPYSFNGQDIFKKELTRKEWYDDPILEDLPKIEIPDNGGMLPSGDVNTFLNEDRKNKLKLLIESVINITNDNALTFNDNHKYHIYWFKILSLCLPREMQNKFSICSHFTNTLIPGNISSQIQIRVNRAESSQFSYAQEAQRGHYAFDFINNIIPDSVKPGKYAETIVKLLSSNVFDVVKFVDSINKIMTAYSVTINEASNLQNLYKADYSSFESADDIYNTILIADRVKYEMQFIANNLWTKEPPLRFSAQQKLSVYEFIFKNITEINSKINIIKVVLDNAVQLGISSDGAIAFRDDLKLKASFIFKYYLEYLKAEGFNNYFARNQNIFIKIFLMFDSLIDLQAVKNAVQTNNYNSSEEAIVCRNIMGSVFRQQLIPDMDILINSANSRINNLGVELLYSIIQDEIKSGSKVINIKNAFDVLQRLRQKNDFAYAYLMYLIKNLTGQEEFIKIYINAQNKDTDFYKRFENDNKNDAFLVDFCKKKDAYSFANQPLTTQTLKVYFEKYYITGAETGIFVKRLNEYLNAVQPDRKEKECNDILNLLLFPASCNRELIPPVYSIVLDTFFSLPYKRIYDLSGKKEWFEKINEIYNSIINSGSSLKQETCEIMLIILCGQILEKYNFKGNNQHVLSFFSKTINDSDTLTISLEKLISIKSINTFIDFYFLPVVNILIFGAIDTSQYDYYGIIEKSFGKIFEKGDLEKIIDNIIYGMKETKNNPINFILFIFRKCLISSSKMFDKKLGDIAYKYFEKLSSGERKKKFAELLDKADEKEIKKFERYFEEFNKEHKKGIFDFLKKK